ncbi:MAG: D-alanyl-D-alanine carboxypeptidase family protein [Dehalococcoidia bacterium]
MAQPVVSRLRLIAGILIAAALAGALGTTSSPAHAAPPDSNTTLAEFVTGDPLTPGSSGVVRAEGDCLRLRETAGLAGRTISCLAEGSTVVILPSVQTADGLRWQLVNTGQLTGWVADAYLAPYAGPPSGAATSAAGAACTAAKPAAYKPGITGFVPTAGGTGMVVWGGGTLAGVENAAMTRGCTPKAVWTSRADGELVGYLFGAPDFVNSDWRSTFSDGWLSGGRVLLIVCEDPASGRVTAATVTVPGGVPPRAPAPIFTGRVPAPTVGATAVAVVDEASGAVLYQKNGHERLPPASLTKIATAILAIEGMEPGTVITSDVDSRTMVESSVLGLVPGDCFPVSDLLYGLMLPSGNDVAIAFARYEAGSEAAFVQQMNMLVKRLGLTDTTFTDPHGLGSPLHRSSAYDIAMLSRYGMTLSRFRDVVKTPTYTARGGRALSMVNTNALLSSYPSADGVKTGFTDDAGRTLAASATKNGHRVYVVLLNDANRDTDARALLDWAFANHQWP